MGCINKCGQNLRIAVVRNRRLRFPSNRSKIAESAFFPNRNCEIAICEIAICDLANCEIAKTGSRMLNTMMTSQPGSRQFPYSFRTLSWREEEAQHSAPGDTPCSTYIHPTMSQDAAGSGQSGRKRKIKFSEQELEFLIEGVSRDHDKLFGKLSRKVPEADKRRIWLRIRAKVNAVGVTQRSIDDLKKRWYDLRGRAKERIAERLGERLATGGGGPTVADNTPLEDLVEDTINPAACVGVTQLDTSRPTQQSQDAETTDSEALHIVETPDETEGESHPATQPGPSQAPAPVSPPSQRDRATPAATGGVHPPPPRRQTRRTATVRSQASGRLRQERTVSTRADREQQAQVLGLGIEARMLAVHRKQAQHMAAMQLQLYKTARNVNQLTESVQELTAAVKENSQLMVQQQDITRRRHRQLLTRLSAYTRSNHLIGNATSQLSRRSLAMQIQMVQCCQDVARALEQVTAAVRHQQVCGHGREGGDDASEGTSSLSSLSVPVPAERRRSTRPSAASRQDTPNVESERRQGASGRRRQ